MEWSLWVPGAVPNSTETSSDLSGVGKILGRRLPTAGGPGLLYYACGYSLESLDVYLPSIPLIDVLLIIVRCQTAVVPACSVVAHTNAPRVHVMVLACCKNGVGTMHPPPLRSASDGMADTGDDNDRQPHACHRGSRRLGRTSVCG